MVMKVQMLSKTCRLIRHNDYRKETGFKMGKKYDFSGWATRNNIRCADGKTIRQDAFKDQDGQTVPLVWNHQHDDPFNVIGHAVLENRKDGVYAYGILNDTDNGQHAKALIQHGDVNALSIYANKLMQKSGDVLHGTIRELSLVLAGANPGAYIETVQHGDELDEEAIIYGGINSIEHSGIDEDIIIPEKDDSKSESEVVEEEKKDMSEEVIKLEHSAVKQPAAQPAAQPATDDETVEDVFNTLNEKQKTAVYAIVGAALSDAGVDPNNDAEGDNNMKHNAFENDGIENNDVISHSEMEEIVGDAKHYGSMRDSFIAHGITDVNFLFPDAKTLDSTPGFIQRDNGWVTTVMGAVHHSPFSRVKSMFANITEDDARAKGYIKGKLKKEEVFSLLKRTTDPQTVYKKQKMDRDDVIDITDFDVISWLKSEMRMMLDEELARAFLVGDGRLSSDDDKISEDHIRPIFDDATLYTIKVLVNVAKGATDDAKAKEFIKACIKQRKNYKGSGNPALFTTEDMLADMLLIEDTTGRSIYDNVAQLATKLRVSDIITVPVMDGVKSADTTPLPLAGIIVNLMDYNVGADKGGEVNMFDDFDIDYNQMKYLIETRCSGALVKPYSAMSIFIDEATA